MSNVPLVPPSSRGVMSSPSHSHSLSPRSSPSKTDGRPILGQANGDRGQGWRPSGLNPIGWEVVSEWQSMQRQNGNEIKLICIL